MRKHTPALFLAGLGVVAAVAASGGAASGATTNSRSPCHAEKAAVADLPQQVSRAWVAKDLDAFGRAFTRDASFIVPGQDTYLTSRDEIKAFMAVQFEGPDITPIANTLDVKCVTRDVGVVVTEGGLLFPGETEVPLERIGRQTWTIVKQGRDWLITAYQNSRITDQC